MDPGRNTGPKYFFKNICLVLEDPFICGSKKYSKITVHNSCLVYLFKLNYISTMILLF